MEQTITTQFEGIWDDFISSFKGSLILESKKQPLTYPAVKLLLSESLSSWRSEFTINGRWLDKLIKEDEQKGMMVKEIITQDIKVDEIKSAKSPDHLKYVIPVGVGAMGCGTAHLTHLGTIGMSCATLLPMLVAYPLTKHWLDGRKEAAAALLINGYVNQLDKYKAAIISTLLA